VDRWRCSLKSDPGLAFNDRIPAPRSDFKDLLGDYCKLACPEQKARGKFSKRKYLDPNYILQKTIDAHGGLALWNSLEAIEADISAWGFLFTAKQRPILNHVKVTAKAHEPRFLFHDFPSPGLTGELIRNDEVRISESDGKIVARRLQPRSAFRGIRRFFYWDALDFIYFGGYATWNYFVSPFLFLRDGFQFEVLESRSDSSLPRVRLGVTFPQDLPTHCRRQIFYFDKNWYVRRLDYTAEVIGHWAHAAHFCENYRDFDGFKAPTQRRVHPLLGKRPLPGPTLVAIEIHDIHPVRIS
jgi:hypothetical protein